jgi:mRNA interferase MazF
LAGLGLAREVKRGEIWTLAGGKDYAGKPRPVVIVQDDRFDKADSITVCPFTTDSTDALLIRIPVEPDVSNGLRLPCRLMVDKIMTAPKLKLGIKIGRLADEHLVQLNRAMLVFLGISASANG